MLGGDGVGFSFHETTIEAGPVNEFHYANHVEAVWLVEGEGTLLDLDNDIEYQLAPGTMYLLNGHERHRVDRPHPDADAVRVQSRRSPGSEVHDENGVYPLVEVPA